MKLSNSKRSSLEITIEGYQFPAITNEVHDANWLQIQFIFTIDGQIWQTTEPCLLTWEVENLIQWLKRISSGKPVDDEWHFIEPVFSFKVIEDEINGKVLRINFSTRHFRNNIDIQVSWIDFRFKNIDFDNAIISLRRQLESYPKREVQE